MRDDDCLAYDPFSGDRDSDVTEFSDRFVVTRKPHVCNVCQEAIPSHSRCRAKTERDNDDQIVMTFYFCPRCCDAMASSWTDDGKAIEVRTVLGMTTARSKQTAPDAPESRSRTRTNDGTEGKQ